MTQFMTTEQMMTRYGLDRISDKAIRADKARSAELAKHQAALADVRKKISDAKAEHGEVKRKLDNTRRSLKRAEQRLVALKAASVLLYVPQAAETDRANVQADIDAFRQLLASVCVAYQLTPEHIYSEARYARLAQVRLALYWMGSHRFNLSTPCIGRLVHRDHTTVLAGRRKVAALLTKKRIILPDDPLHAVLAIVDALGGK